MGKAGQGGLCCVPAGDGSGRAGCRAGNGAEPGVWPSWGMLETQAGWPGTRRNPLPTGLLVFIIFSPGEAT